MLSNQKDNIRQVSDLTEKIKITLQNNKDVNQEFGNILQNTKTVTQNLEALSKILVENSRNVTGISQNMTQTTIQLKSSIKDYLDNNKELVDKYRIILNSTLAASEKYVQRFEVIDSGLKGIFNQIQIGLKDYQTITAENLNKYLREFTSQLTNAHKGLESNILSLSEITEELTEQIENLNRRK